MFDAIKQKTYYHIEKKKHNLITKYVNTIVQCVTMETKGYDANEEL